MAMWLEIGLYPCCHIQDRGASVVAGSLLRTACNAVVNIAETWKLEAH